MADSGWYPDPEQPTRLRYFDGQDWTDETQPWPEGMTGEEPTQALGSEHTLELDAPSSLATPSRPSEVEDTQPWVDPDRQGSSAVGSAPQAQSSPAFSAQHDPFQPGYAGPPAGFDAGPQPGYQQPGGQGFDGQGFGGGYQQPSYQQPAYSQPAYPQAGYQQPATDFQPYGGFPPQGFPEPRRGLPVVAWVLIVTLIAAAGGLGVWLAVRNNDKAEPTPVETTSAPSPTQSEEPTPEPTREETPAPEPTREETPAPEPTREETPTPEPSQGGLVERGSDIVPQACGGRSVSSRGQLDSEGRISTTHMSVPLADGFTPMPVRLPFLNRSNAQGKMLGDNWMSTIAVGTLRKTDGFTDPEQAAVRLVSCMLGDDELYSDAKAGPAKVERIERKDGGSVVILDAFSPISGVDGVDEEEFIVLAVSGLSRDIEVMVALANPGDKASYDAVGKALADVRTRR